MSLPTPKSGTGLIHALAVKSTSTDQTVDIKGITTEISYYESIDLPSMSMTLNLADGIGFRTSLPLIGGEIISYSLSDSDKNAVKITGSQQVYKLSNKIRVAHNLDGYSIFLSSQEMIKDQYTIISNTQESINVDQMVKKIFDEYITPISNKKLITLESTDGLFDSTFPRVSPFTALNYLAEEAKAADTRSSSNYFFFENSKGYHFASFQYLMRQPPKTTFYYLENRIPGDEKFERNRIVSMEEEVGFDILNGVSTGQFGTQVLSIDPVAKRFRSSQYLYNKDFAQVDHTDQYPRLAPQVSKTLGSSISREKFIISNSHRGNVPFVTERDTNSQNTFRRRQDFLASETASRADLMSNITKLLVDGVSNLNAGDTIMVMLPQSGQSNLTRRQTDGFAGGKYLITAVAHRFGPLGMRYGTAIECVKDSYSQPVSGRA